RNLESKYYKYTAPEYGYVRFKLSKNDTTTTNQSRWLMQVYDSNVNLQYDNLGGEDAESYYVMVNRGDVIYIRVTGAFEATNIKYLLKPDFTAHPYVAKEPNDNASNAIPLIFGQKYYGIIDKANDVDMFKLTATANGNVVFNLKKESISTNQPNWYMTFYNEEMTQIFETHTENGNTENLQGLNYVLRAGQTVYVKIRSYSNAEYILYSLSTSFSPLASVEAEPNNSYKKATPLTLGSSIYGTLCENTADFYTFKSGKKGKYKVNLSLSNDVTYGYKVSVYDASHNLIKSSLKPIFISGSFTFKAKKKKKYFVVVEHYGGGLVARYSYGALYELNVAK
ncbi:MAG: hypothetical protein K6F00_11460, partial [Lachnospiraceae bacterium]|nr:hypothetical protein [Lachnospiraceae bacterium]